MTNVDPEEIVTVARGGITVEKSFEPDDFPVPAIAFVIRSDRDETVSVKLADAVPDDVEPENVGFHPKYGAEFWDVEGTEIVFEREFAPNEEFTTVYGLRGGDTDAPSKFLTEPTLETIDPPREEAAADTPDDSEEAVDVTVESVGEDAGPIEPEVEGDTEVDIDRVVEAGDGRLGNGDTVDDGPSGDDETAAGAEVDSGSTEPTSGDGDESSVEDLSNGSDGERLLDSLASELESADPDDPAVAELRDALGIDLTRTTVEARIEHLQSAVADLQAYTDALEAFLDENGDAQQVLEEIRDGYDETTTRLDEIESDVERVSESTETTEDRLDTVEEQLETVEERLETGTEDLGADVRKLESDLESLEEDLSKVVELRDRLTTALGGLGSESAASSSEEEPPRETDDKTDEADTRQPHEATDEVNDDPIGSETDDDSETDASEMDGEDADEREDDV